MEKRNERNFFIAATLGASVFQVVQAPLLRFFDGTVAEKAAADRGVEVVRVRPTVMLRHPQKTVVVVVLTAIVVMPNSMHVYGELSAWFQSSMLNGLPLRTS